MEELPQVGFYRHCKGNYYKVLGIARDANNTAMMKVAYQALYTSPEFGKGQIWLREITDFMGFKEHPDGRKEKRFAFIGTELPSELQHLL